VNALDLNDYRVNYALTRFPNTLALLAGLYGTRLAVFMIWLGR